MLFCPPDVNNCKQQIINLKRATWSLKVSGILDVSQIRGFYQKRYIDTFSFEIYRARIM